jgi:hypothetical protein
MNIGIVYICTGEYRIFWKDFYDSSEKYFLSKAEKHYFIFTDDKTITDENNISVLYRAPGGFPYDSLMRFEMFMQIRELLERFDYIYFFNSNMLFLQPVENEILPVSSKSELVGVVHPGYYNKTSIWYPFERNKRSLAYVSSTQNRFVYFMGSVIGGTSSGFIELSHQCNEWTKSDLLAGIIPIYHDESYLNKYFLTKNVHKLDPGYAYPEGWKLPFNPKIQLINKVVHGGKYFVKVQKPNIFKRIINKVGRFIMGLKWYISG